MIVIDTNALVLLLVGLIDPRQIEVNSRTSIYTDEDFHKLVRVIGQFEDLLTLPNVWTEVDNLLNGFNGGHKEKYVQIISQIISKSTEKYLDSSSALNGYHFYPLGLTDSLLLALAKDAKLLITSDSQLSLYALSEGINVYDIVNERNKDFLL